MIAKNIDQIIQEDLQALINNSVLESKTIEYKQSLPGNSDSEKKEFLANISSFANASGGDLIYGITEDRTAGIPSALEGLSIDNVDQEISRLESIIRDGLQPRVLGIIIKSLKLQDSKTVVIIRIPKSWISPHRVVFGGHDKFYSRSNTGRYPLDVVQLRIAFNLSETLTERIRKFRETRISNIFANETPLPFQDEPKIVLHLVPLVSFNPAQSYDINRVASNSLQMGPMRGGSWDVRYNFDGFLTYHKGPEGISKSYVQLYRNGIIEAVQALNTRSKDGKTLFSISYEKDLIRSLPGYLSTLKSLNIDLPILLFLTLVGVKGCSIHVDSQRFWRDEVHTIDRDILLLPEILIERYDLSARDILKPCFDSIWNACGFEKWWYYDIAR